MKRVIGQAIERLQGQKELADAAAVFAVRILSALLAFGVQIFLARALDLTEYGVYVTLWTWLIVLSNVAAFGFSDTSIRFIPRYTFRGKHAWVKGFLATGYKTVVLCSILVSLVGLVTLMFFADLVDPLYLIPIAVLFVGLPFSALELYLVGVARSFGWFMLTVVPGYVVRPLLIAGGVLVVLRMGHAADAATVLAIATVITGLTVIVQTLIIRRRVLNVCGDVEPGGPSNLWRRVSAPLVLMLAVDEIFLWSDILIVSVLMAPPDVSIYFAAQRSMSLAAFVRFAFMMVLARDLSMAKAGRDAKHLQAKVTKASTWTFWLMVPAVLITVAAGYPLLAMFGPEFTSGYPIMLVLGIGFLFQAVIGQAQDLMIILGHQRTNIVIGIGSIALNVILSVILVPHFGILGVAMATAATYAARAVVYVFAIKHLHGLWVFAEMPKFTGHRKALTSDA
ncbi:MAG: polysaccharide biosynthesis C-terminal domain-containing protein [Pseudomonadota bacterium]